MSSSKDKSKGEINYVIIAIKFRTRSIILARRRRLRLDNLIRRLHKTKNQTLTEM